MLRRRPRLVIAVSPGYADVIFVASLSEIESNMGSLIIVDWQGVIGDRLHVGRDD